MKEINRSITTLANKFSSSTMSCKEVETEINNFLLNNKDDWESQEQYNDLTMDLRGDEDLIKTIIKDTKSNSFRNLIIRLTDINRESWRIFDKMEAKLSLLLNDEDMEIYFIDGIDYMIGKKSWNTKELNTMLSKYVA